MTTQVEISTVAATKAIQTLRQTVVALDKALRPLSRTITDLNTKMQKGAGAKSFSMEQRRAERTASRLSKELIRQEKVAARLRRRLRDVSRTTKSLGRAQHASAAGSLRANAAIRGQNTLLRNLGSSAIFAVGPLSGVGARINALGAISTRTGVQVALLAAGFAALVIAAFKLAQAMVRTKLTTDRIINSLKAATGSSKAALVEFNFLVRTTNELNVSLEKAGLQFAQLAAAARGTTLQGKGVRDIFASVAKASVVLGLTSEQTEGALRAIQQIMSKGTVQAEELRGQLGERLPGAFRLAAQAMGVTTQELGKMLEQGQVISEDFLPKFAEELEKAFGPQVAGTVDQLRGTVEGLKNEFFLLAIQLEEDIGLVETLAGGLQALRSLLRTGRLLTGSDILIDLVDATADLKEAEDKLANLIRVFGNKDRESFQPGGLAGQAAIFGAALDVIQARQRLRETQAEIAGPFPGAGTGPPPVPPDLADVSIKSIDTVREAIADLNRIIVDLRDTSISFSQRSDLVDAFERSENAAKKAAKIVKGLDAKELTAAFVQFGIETGTAAEKTDQLRTSVSALIIKQLELKEEADDRTKVLKDQQKETERLAAQQDKDRLAADKRGKAIIASAERAKAAFESRIKVAKDALKIEKDSSLTTEEKLRLVAQLTLFEAELFRQRKAGVPLTSPEELAALRAQTDQIVLMKEKIKDLRDASAENKRIARDFANVIGSAFEDAVIKGNDLRSVLQGLFEDIQRIILRLLVTKPFETFLTGLLTGGGGGGVGLFTQQTGGISGIVQGLLGLGGVGGGGFSSPLSEIPRLAHGGSFKVGGVGGVDRNRVTMDLTRGETLTVTPANENVNRPIMINIITRDPDTFVESPDQVALRGANIITRARQRSR